MLISVIGVDGVGKSTLVHRLVMSLDSTIDCVALKIPLFANNAFIRYDYVLDEIEAHADSLAGHFRSELIALECLRFAVRDVEPAVSAGKLVICDRYIESCLLYLRARALPTPTIERVLQLTARPTLTILLKAEQGVRHRRLARLGESLTTRQWEMMELTAGLLEQHASDIGALVIDATQPVENVAEQAAAFVLSALHKHSG